MRRHAKGLTAARLGIYAFLLISAAFFLLPLYVMMITSLKGMPEIRQGNLLAPPSAPTIAAWIKAWSSACTGLSCDGIQVGFRNSVTILLPVGHHVDRGRRGHRLRALVVAPARRRLPVRHADGGGLHPLPGVPLSRVVRMFSSFGINCSLPGIIVVHTVFGLPTMTLIFRNFFAGIPLELIKAARIDGAGFWRIFGADHAADGGAHHRGGRHPADDRHLERLHLRVGLRRTRKLPDDGAAQQHRQLHARASANTTSTWRRPC